MKTIKNLKEEIVFLLVLSLLLIAKITFAQTPELVKDINPTPNESGDPESFVLFNDEIYFTASDVVDGDAQVWVTNGSTVNALPGLPSDHYFSDVTIVGSQITFYGESSEGDEKQFFYDGTTLSTIDVIMNRPIFYNGEILFAGESAETGQELFKYDGTEVTLVEDIREGTLHSYLSNFIVYDNKLVFSADDGTNGKVLWEYDGTSVQLIEDINPGYTNGNFSGFTIVGDNLFFAGYGALSGWELYKYDGTDVTLIEIASGAAGSSPQDFHVYNNQLIFRASDEDGVEVFAHDGTTLTNLNINESGSSHPSGFTVFNDKLYFAADDGINGSELWQYDGINASMAADINVGVGASNVEDPFVNGPYLYFKAYNFDRPSRVNPGRGLRVLEDLSGIFRFDGENFDFVTSEIDYEFNDENGIIPIALGNYVYFKGESASVGRELYRMRAISQEADILTFSISEQVEEPVINSENQTVSVLMPAGADLTNLTPTISISEFAEIDLTGAQDFTDPVAYTITSEFGNIKQWMVTVTVAEPDEPVLANGPENEFNIYPQPAQNVLNIQTGNAAMTRAQIKIYDLMGALFLETQTSVLEGEMTFDISTLPSGMWLMQIDSGQFTKDLRFIKK